MAGVYQVDYLTSADQAIPERAEAAIKFSFSDMRLDISDSILNIVLWFCLINFLLYIKLSA